jgi:hypothetical protein
VDWGSDLRGIDFRVQRVPAQTLHGVITNPEAAGESLVVLLASRQPLLRDQVLAGAGVDPLKHTFQLTGVIPGSYWLIAGGNNSNGRAAQTRLAVDVGNDPPEALDLTLTPGAELAGSVQVEDGAEVPLDTLDVMLSPLDTSYFVSQSRVKAGPDGAFTLNGVVPGRYRLDVGGAPSAYVKSVLLGEREVSQHGLDIAAGAAGPLRITLSTKMSKVQATIEGAPSREGAMVSVVLLVDDADAQQPRFQQTLVMKGSTQRVEIGVVAPGRYRLFAVESNNSPILGDPALARMLESRSSLVEAPEDGVAQATVQLITADQLQRVLTEER